MLLLDISLQPVCPLLRCDCIVCLVVLLIRYITVISEIILLKYVRLGLL
jgi:hypothetical protein